MGRGVSKRPLGSDKHQMIDRLSDRPKRGDKEKGGEIN